MSNLTSPSAGIFKISNFVFSELFKNFKSEDVDLFVFDNVSLTFEAGSTTTATFSGDLKMTGILAIFKKFLNSDSAIHVIGKIETSVGLEKKISPQNVTLTSLIPFHKPLFTGVTLTTIYLRISIKKTGAKWTITPTLVGLLDVDNITDNDEGKISLIVSLEDKNLKLSAEGKNINGAFGLENLMLDAIRIEGIIGPRKQLIITTKFEVGETTFTFDGIITPNSIGMIASAANFSLGDLSNIFQEISHGNLKLPDFDVSFNKTSIAFASTDCKIGKVSLEKGLTLSADITAHGHTVATRAQISTSGVSFDGSIGNLDVGPVSIKKAGLDFQIYKNAANKPTLFKIYGQANIENVDVECGLYFEKQTSTWVTVLYAGVEADNISFSTFFPSTKNSFVDQLSLSKLSFIFASADCKPQRSEGIAVKTGLQLLATVKEIPGLSDLTGEDNANLLLAAHFGSTMDISIAMPDTRLELGDSVETDPFKIQITILPEPSVALVFGMDVTIPNQPKPLHFDMVLELGVIEATGSITMKNYWRNPFGINGLKIGPAVAIQLGINYAQFTASGVPSEFGIAGGLAIGDKVIDMAVNISTNPLEEILSGSLKQLSVKELIEFASEMVSLTIPEEDVPDFLDIKNLELYVAPAGGSIGTIIYKPGFSFSCDLVIIGKEVEFYIRISDNGIEGAGHIDQINFGPLKISGEEGKDASMNLELTTSEQALNIDGSISFLGAKQGVFVDISNNGIEFKFEQNFLNLLTFEVQGKSAGTISKPSILDFQLAADMDNDITAFLKNDVSNKIDSALKSASQDIGKAQKEVDKAKNKYQAEYDSAQEKLNTAQKNADAHLKKLQENLSNARNAYNSDMRKAQTELNNAKTSYNRALGKAQGAVTKAEKDYNSGIAVALNKVNQAERTYNSGISAAQNAVNAAQRKYGRAIGSAQSAMRSASRKVDSLLGNIKSAKRKIKKLKWYEKAASIYYGSKLAGLYTAYGTAKGVLAAAGKILEGIKYGGEYAVFESAKAALQVAKTGAKYTAFQSAKTALQAAKTGAKYTAFEGTKKTLEALRYGSEYTVWQAAEKTLAKVRVAGQASINLANSALGNIGRSAVYLALQAAKVGLEAVKNGTSAIAFDGAKAAMEAAKAGSAAVLGLANYIAQHSGDIFDVRSMHISGSLKKIESGELFNAELDVSILGNDYQWSLKLNVKDVADFMSMLFTKAFNEAKSIAGF